MDQAVAQSSMFERTLKQKSKRNAQYADKRFAAFVNTCLERNDTSTLLKSILNARFKDSENTENSKENVNKAVVDTAALPTTKEKDSCLLLFNDTIDVFETLLKENRDSDLVQLIQEYTIFRSRTLKYSSLITELRCLKTKFTCFCFQF